MSRPPMQFPEMPGKTPRERFENLARRVMSVPKSEIDRREAEWRKERAKKKRQRQRKTRTVVMALVVFSASRLAAQCCGDCNGDGRVTINEILTSVNNALDGCSVAPTPIGGSTATPAPTPTALPDQCATDVPGTRLSLLGTNYVIVEFEVVLEGSTRTYLLRYPVQVDSSSHVSNVQNPIYLQQSCRAPLQPCGKSGWDGYSGSICGFPTLFYDGGSVMGDFHGGSNTSYSEDASGATWTYEPRGFLSAYITIDAGHDPIYLSSSGSTGSRTVSVGDLSGHGYSFARANYPEPTSAELSQLFQGLASFYAHVSLRAAPLPSPPAFPQQ
jgi:hypothetical protein